MQMQMQKQMQIETVDQLSETKDARWHFCLWSRLREFGFETFMHFILYDLGRDKLVFVFIFRIVYLFLI